MGKTIGIILIAVGLATCLLISAWVGVQFSTDQLNPGAAVLGFSLGTIALVLPLVSVGGFMFWKGSQEAKTQSQANQQRQLLNMVSTRGQIAISDLAIEMDISRDTVQHLLYDLVGKRLFSGYVNWDEGMLYSRQASQLQGRETCEVCSGQVELAGQGVIRCPYCGTEYFL